MNQTPVFVYGTLRNPGGTNPQGNYAWALAGRTVSEQPATLPNALMRDNRGGFPFVSRSDAHATDVVHGELMYLNPDLYDAVVRDLDSLEGFHGEGVAHNMYDRVLVDVTLEDGTVVEASTYLVAPSLLASRAQFLPVVTSGDWMNRTPVRDSLIYG